ncbi:MAG: ABC transporter ATP-binding protein [Acidobacteriota bacterium]
MNETPLLIVEQAEKIYANGPQSVAALRGVSFSVQEGEFISLMGPSGCGKSTLLHICGAIDRPSRGHVALDGESLDSLTEEAASRLRRERVGFVFQFFNLLPTLTVAENVALPMMLAGRSERESRERAHSLLDRVGLLARAAHFPAELSGGEMQRAAVARALINEPRLLLADEPTGNLDSENGVQVMRLLLALNRDLGKTIILATHSEEAASFTTRTIRMKDGLIISDRRIEPSGAIC